jgi:hypothetical protein
MRAVSTLTRAYGAASPATKRERRVISGAERYIPTWTLVSPGLMHKMVVGAVDRRTGGSEMPEVSRNRRAATITDRESEQSQEPAGLGEVGLRKVGPDRTDRSGSWSISREYSQE